MQLGVVVVLGNMEQDKLEHKQQSIQVDMVGVVEEQLHNNKMDMLVSR